MAELLGLTAAEVAERVARGQVNRTPRSEWSDYLQIIGRNLLTWFNAMVTPAAIALFVLGEYQGALAVSGMAIVNTSLGLVQELRAKRHLDKLAILVQTRVQVIRDSQTQVIPADDVVLGEYVRLESGDSIVADGPVIDAHFLEVDEALLTGESDPIRRNPGDRLLSGSFCVAGEGIYRAETIGAQSFAQQTSAQARRYHQAVSPLTHVINRIVQVLTYVAVSLILVYMIAYFLQGFPKTLEQKRDFVRMIAATITSMVPQGLVLTATMAFTLGAIVMSLRGAIVQRLSAVETMASIDVICTDKTGTLTTNNLRLEEIVFLEPSLGEDAIRQKIRAFAWASIDHSNRNIQALRSALGQESRRAGSVSDRSAPVEPIDQIPFKSQNRYSAVRLRDNDGDQILVMGALEALHERIEFWRDTPKPAGESSSLRGALDSLNAQIAERQAQGQRLIVFGQITDDIVLANLTSLPMVPLQPLALLCFGDELRPEAPKVLQALAGQGIAFKVLSGDNPDTVRGTIGHLDLSLASGVAGAESSKPRHPAAHQGFEDSVPATLRVVSGQELSESADAESLIREHSIFGRVTPEQKVQIVEMLRKMGHRVAMIGDGVNDVLPIKKADLGIAMGEGSQASKTVSGLVLENNNFALLPETLEEGRVIVRNLRRLAKLFLVKNVYSLILILAYASGWFGIPFPYVPQQVTLLNWLVIGIPAFVIALSRERSTRASKPRFLLEVGWFALRTGIVFGLAGVVTLLIAGKLQSDEKYQHTMLLSVLILLGITALLRALRDGDGESLKADTRFRLLGAFAIPVYLAAMYWPLSAWFFELWPLEVVDWAMVLAVAGVAYLLSLISDLIPVPNAMSVISWHQSASDRAR